ncbi:MAG: DNA repair protein RadA [Chloroflexi bacterium]|nr:DNA repair protein RadA [Chloroflexota bacterium]
MPRTRTEFVCRECGFRTPRALGRCPTCDAWSSFDEVREASQPTGAATRRNNGGVAAALVTLDQIVTSDAQRLHLGMPEVARVLGGGIVPGSLTLIGGDPGVGKSTLLTQLAHDVASQAGKVVYVSGEESLAQVGLRARRMGISSPHLLFLSETDADSIVSTIDAARPKLAIIDSVQSVMAADVDAVPGSVSQLRECALRFLHLAKSTATAVFLVGHVTKEGAIAGPKVLEHMVDTVLYLEGERVLMYRVLRCVKNRFGPTNEVGVFEMHAEGLHEVGNPSALFLAQRGDAAPGSVVTVAIEGTRPLLVEVQALVSKSSLAMPRRASTGFPANRLHLISAVISRRLGVPLYDQDVYLNVVGGLELDEPAADLAAALAIVSSARDAAVPRELVAIGEIGLAGELRGVSQMKARLHEAAKLGFLKAVVPRGVVHQPDIDTLQASTLREAARALSV